MDLTEFADERMEQGSGENLSFAGENSRRILESFESEEIAAPLIATTFWQAFLYSSAFDYTLYRELDRYDRYYWPYPLVPEFYRFPERLRKYPNYYGSDPFYPYRGPTSVVLSHGTSRRRRYDLVIFVPGLRMIRGQDSFIIDRVRIDSPDIIEEGWHNFLRTRQVATSEQRPGPAPEETRDKTLAQFENADMLLRYGPRAAVEAYEAQPFGILFVNTPELIPTKTTEMSAALPSPAMNVCVKDDDEPLSTAGMVATNGKGKLGVTTALHAMPKRRKKVLVGGREGTIVSRDIWSDSCFIEVPSISMSNIREAKGPLVGKTPRSNEDVSFEGVTSGKISTIVTGWDPRLPYFEKDSQFTVITKPVTAPGDSGAALMDTDGQILGFAYSRTGFGEKYEFAAWIWAQGVFAKHGLS